MKFSAGFVSSPLPISQRTGLRTKRSRNPVCSVGARSNSQRPRLAVFDLDGTLWNPAMYQLWGGGGAPFRPAPSGHAVIDRSGTYVRLLGNSAALLAGLKRSDIMVGLASSTDEPDWADECMEKISVDDEYAMKDCIDLEEIHKGSKRTHFEALHRRSRIPYEEMIFFDNENGNIVAVRPLGVHCCHCPDGMTQDVWAKALRDFAVKHAESAV